MTAGSPIDRAGLADAIERGRLAVLIADGNPDETTIEIEPVVLRLLLDEIAALRAPTDAKGEAIVLKADAVNSFKADGAIKAAPEAGKLPSEEALLKALRPFAAIARSVERTNAHRPDDLAWVHRADGTRITYGHLRAVLALLSTPPHDAPAHAPRDTEEAGGWQDISTAPKDGTAVLLFADDRVGEGEWRGRSAEAEDDGWTGWWWANTGIEYHDRLSPSPTHWMPLPAAPEPTR